MLDSFGYYDNAFIKEIRTMRDSNSEDLTTQNVHRDTFLDPTYNDFKITLSNRHDIPMFRGPNSNTIYLSPGNQLSYLQEYFFNFKTTQRFFDTNLKNEYKPEIRQCYFEDEAKHLMLTAVYTQNNCIFKCKLEMVLEICKCLPWFITSFEDAPVCNLFGNKCYEQKLLLMNVKLDFTDQSNPPCGCYPNCEETNYIPYLDKNGGSNTLRPIMNKILLDLKYPNFIPGGPDWLNDSFVVEQRKDKFMFPYVRDIFLGKISKLKKRIFFIDSFLSEKDSKIFYSSDNLTSDVDNFQVHTRYYCIFHYYDTSLSFTIDQKSK